MTKQIRDKIWYQGRLHEISAHHGTGLFRPQDHGIEPVAFSTACHRGYHCVYALSDQVLYLDQVHLGLGAADQASLNEGVGPLLYGSGPERYVQYGHREDLLTGNEQHSWLSHDYRVTGLRERVSFSGGLLIVAEPLEEASQQYGYPDIYRYTTVSELVLLTGRLREARRLSVEAAMFRQQHPPQSTRLPKRREYELVEAWCSGHLRFDYGGDR